MAENIGRTLKVCLFMTTKVIKSHVKLHMKSNITKIPRESTPYITLFTARSRIFLPAAILRVALSWPPRKPTVFARLACWQLMLTEVVCYLVKNSCKPHTKKKTSPLQKWVANLPSPPPWLCSPCQVKH